MGGGVLAITKTAFSYCYHLLQFCSRSGRLTYIASGIMYYDVLRLGLCHGGKSVVLRINYILSVCKHSENIVGKMNCKLLMLSACVHTHLVYGSVVGLVVAKVFDCTLYFKICDFSAFVK